MADRAQKWLDELQAGGRYSFSRQEMEAALGISPAASRARLRRLRRAGRIATPRRGFHVIVPPEFRAAGAPPVPWFLHDLMEHLGRPYYVGILTGAALHGAAHQRPVSFQVVVDRPLRPIRVGRTRIEFHVRRRAAEMPVSWLPTETGGLRLGTPETIAWDLVRYPSAAGGWENVATVLEELGNKLRPRYLGASARLVRQSEVQRLGYLLERLGFSRAATALAGRLEGHRTHVVPLNPAATGTLREPAPPWNVVPGESTGEDR